MRNQIWRIEICAIQQIEDLNAKLHILGLVKARVFLERHIPRRETGPNIRVSSKIAKETATVWRSDECVGIEPLIGISQNHRAGKCRIHESADRISRVAVIRRVISQLRSERKTGLRRHDAVHGPPSI